MMKRIQESESSSHNEEKNSGWSPRKEENILLTPELLNSAILSSARLAPSFWGLNPHRLHGVYNWLGFVIPIRLIQQLSNSVL